MRGNAERVAVYESIGRIRPAEFVTLARELLHARDPSRVQFCPWYPLAEAADHAPAAEGVLQLRLAQGLLDYPSGKSAMVHYEHAADVRAAAIALASRLAGRDLLCRHLEIDAPRDVAAIHAKVLGDFVRRFGSPPVLPP